MKSRLFALSLCALVIVACSNESASPTAAPKPPESARSEIVRHEPVVVYAAYKDEAYLPSLFANFTRETGVRVTVRHSDQKTIVDDVINDRGSPRADVLLSSDVFGIWRAADEGALRPLVGESISKTINARVPAYLRDPDGAWVAASARAAVIAYNSGAVEPATLTGYDSLADEAHRGSVCLSSSSLPINRSLVAMLIDELGVRPAEIVIRGWVKNLALPVFESEAELIAAISAGSCALGVVSAPDKHSGANDGEGIGIFMPHPAFVDIEGIGVARHAREPESARKLVEWLLTSHAGELGDDQHSTRNVGVAGWRADEAIKLAERAGYR